MTARTDFPVNSVAIELEFTFATSRARLWDALVNRMGEWWSEPYSMVDRRESLSIDARAGGGLVERGSDGSEFLWATVTAVKREELLEFQGSVGMDGATFGWVRFRLEDTGASCRLKLSHRALGEPDPETKSSYDAGWKDMIQNRVGKIVQS